MGELADLLLHEETLFKGLPFRALLLDLVLENV